MKPPFIPSDEQQAFFDAALGSADNLALCAVAGAGKTETLVQLTRQLPRPTRCVVLMFGRGNADDAAARMPYDVVATTFHSYAYNAIKRVVGKMRKPNSRKCAAFVKCAVPEWRDRKEWEGDLLTLVSRAKSFGVGFLPDAPTIVDLREMFGLDVPDTRLSLVDEVLHLSMQVLDELDFDDMLLHGLRPEVKFDHADWVLVDEAQDTNAVQAALLEKINAQRVVIVGDPFQAIYAFRGAGANAYTLLRDRFACRELPLSVSRRCSQAVAAEARRVLAQPVLKREAEGRL